MPRKATGRAPSAAPTRIRPPPQAWMIAAAARHGTRLATPGIGVAREKAVTLKASATAAAPATASATHALAIGGASPPASRPPTRNSNKRVGMRKNAASGDHARVRTHPASEAPAASSRPVRRQRPRTATRNGAAP